jgi:hypothetical protein
VEYPEAGWHRCDQGNSLWTGPKSVQEMLWDRGISATALIGGVPLPQNEGQAEINAGRPFIIGWVYDLGGGHAILCHGQQGAYVYYFEPGPLSNNFQVNTYNWVVDGANHTWSETLKTNNSPNPPVPDIKVNGSDGTYYATASTYLNMTVRLTDGQYAGTQADWWVMGYFSGVYVYLDQSGNWTTTPSTWSQSNLMDIYSTIFSGTLGAGTYTIYFGVDLTRDGVIDDPMYYDYITIVVQ